MKSYIQIGYALSLTFLLSGFLILAAEGQDLHPAGLREDFAVGTTPQNLAFDGANIWVTNLADGTVTKLRASDGELQGTFSIGSSPNDIVFDGANIWVSHTDSSGGHLTKLRASDGVVLGTFAANGAWGLAFDGTNILVANRGFGTITKLRASDGQFQGLYLVDPEPEFLTIVKDNLWVGFNHADTVQEVRLSD
ncbi:MAG TPA: hypothetical protein VGF08_05110, partial [Terriglobales bacterium]